MDTLLYPLWLHVDEALFIARIIFGVVFLYFGIPKIRDLKGNAADFNSMGFRPGWLWGTPVALLETVGSLFIILGIFISPVALLFAIHMLVGTVWKIVKAKKSFPDWSYDLILFAIAILLATLGPGSIALFPLL